MKKYKRFGKNAFIAMLALASIWGLFAAVGEVMSRFSDQVLYDIVGCEDEKCMLVEDDIRSILDKDFNDLLLGAEVSQVDLKAIEARLKAEPNIEMADVFLDSKTRLRVRVKPRQAAMRVLDKFGQSYYVDINGIKFPLSHRYTPRVIVVSGNIPAFDKPMEDLDSTHCIRQLFELWRLLESDLFLQALVEQIYVDENGDMVMIPKIGSHDIVFGYVDENSLERLENLKIFYQEAMPVTGWNEYKRLSIKYKDQVIASR